MVGKKIYVKVTVADGTNYLGSNNNDATDATENGTENVKANGYTVEYYQGATKINTSTLTPGATTNNNLAAYNGTEPTGWEFAGWSANNETTSTTVTYTDEQNITTDIVAGGQTAKLYAIFTRDVTVTYTITADTSSTDTETKTQYYNPNGDPTSVSVTLPDVTEGKKENIFDGWDNSSGTKVGDAGDSISVTEDTDLTSRWKHIDIDTVKIRATKYGSGQLRLDNIPDDVTVRVWTPTRYLSDKQRNKIYCQRNEPNLVLDSTHNSTQSYKSRGTMPSTYTDVYMDVQDKNGNVIYSERYCDLTSATSGEFVEDDYQGEIYIYNPSLTNKSNTVSKSNTSSTTPVPSLTSNGNINFDLAFKTTSSETDTYYAEYSVIIVNDTSQDFKFYKPADYTPTAVYNNTPYNDYIDYDIKGINVGESIFAGTSIPITVRYDFRNPATDDKGANRIYYIDNGVTPNLIDGLQEDTNTRLYATVPDATGDLTGANTRAPYTIEVTNEFDIAKTFTLSIKETTKFIIVDKDGKENPQYTIAAGQTDNPNIETFTFYLQKADGAEYKSADQKVTIKFTPEGTEPINVGMVSATVEVNSSAPDPEPPIISNVEFKLSDTPGEAKLTWEGSDEDSITNYYIYLYKKNGSYVNDFNTGNYIPEYTITGLTEGESYYATVYGKDPTGNTGYDYLSGASTDQGFACRSEDVEARWVFYVTINNKTNNETTVTYPSGTSLTVNRDETFSIDFTRTKNNWGTNTAVTMGGETTKQYTFDTSNNPQTATMTIPNVTGDLVITVSSYTTEFCLVEGTPILLANGTYKNVEEINYTDLLEVYDHVNGRMTKVYPIWIEQQGTSDYYEKLTFSDGTELKVVGEHCLYSVDLKRYINVADESECSVGTRVYKVNNDKLEEVTITNIEYINEEVKYYNVVSAIQYNIIANGLLTTDPTSSISNVYGFKENAIYSENYKVLSTQNQLAYEDCNFVPYYLYKGLNLKNIASLIGKELDVSFLSDFVNRRTLDLINKDGKVQFMMTTSLDDLESVDKEKYLHEEGSIYKLPETGADYFIETSTGTRYKPGNTVTVDYSMHFEAVNNTSILSNIRTLLQKIQSISK